MMIVLVIGIISGYLSHSLKSRPTVFLHLFNFCCFLYACYFAVTIFMHIRLGDNIYWIRTIVNLPLFFLGWYVVVNLKKIQLMLLKKCESLSN